jgi:hypothetical protein
MCDFRKCCNSASCAVTVDRNWHNYFELPQCHGDSTCRGERELQAGSATAWQMQITCMPWWLPAGPWLSATACSCCCESSGASGKSLEGPAPAAEIFTEEAQHIAACSMHASCSDCRVRLSFGAYAPGTNQADWCSRSTTGCRCCRIALPACQSK